MAEYYGAADKFDEICQWYDGYRFGKTEIFNPWSVVNYFSNECEPRPFWVSTGSNDIIGEVLAQADEEIYNRLTALVNGETFTTFIDTGVIYPQIKSNPSTIYSFLLVTGYLKALKTTPSFSGDFMCEVSMPNRESGDGHYDIQLKPTKKELPGILIELKAEKNCSDEQLKKLSETAL